MTAETPRSAKPRFSGAEFPVYDVGTGLANGGGENVLATGGTSGELRSGTREAPESDAWEIVIDDDSDFRESLGRLLTSVGVQSRLFPAIASSLESVLP